MPNSALNVARTGLEAQDARIRVIANNLANIGTTGFKRDRVDFATLAYQEKRVAGQQSTAQTQYAVGLNLGTGVLVQGTSRIETQGNLNATGTFDGTVPIVFDASGNGWACHHHRPLILRQQIASLRAINTGGNNGVRSGLRS